MSDPLLREARGVFARLREGRGVRRGALGELGAAAQDRGESKLPLSEIYTPYGRRGNTPEERNKDFALW